MRLTRQIAICCLLGLLPLLTWGQQPVVPDGYSAHPDRYHSVNSADYGGPSGRLKDLLGLWNMPDGEYSGLFTSSAMAYDYPLVFDQRPHSKRDMPLMRVNQETIVWEETEDATRVWVGPQAKLHGTSFRGNSMYFLSNEGDCFMQGRIESPLQYEGKNAPIIDLAGLVHAQRGAEAPTQMTLTMGIHLNVTPSKIFDGIAENFNIATQFNEAFSFENGVFLHSLAEILDAGKAKESKMQKLLKMKKAAGPGDYLEVAKLLSHDLLLTDMTMMYDKEHHSWYSRGKAPVLLCLGSEDLPHRLGIDTKIEFVPGAAKAKGGHHSDTLDLYMEADEFTWLYIRIAGNEVRIASSHPGELAPTEEAQDPGAWRYLHVGEGEKDEFVVEFICRYIYQGCD